MEYGFLRETEEIMKFFNDRNINMQLFYSDDFLNNKIDLYRFI